MKFSKLSINPLQISNKNDLYISKDRFCYKNENTSIITLDRPFKEFKSKHKYQILEDYWKKRKMECEKNLSKFC